MHFSRPALLAVVGLVLLAGSATAQDDDKRVDQNKDGEKNCAKAAKILAKGHVEQEDLWAFSVIVKCPGAGASLAGAWSPVPNNSGDLFSLAARSKSVADVRIVNAVLAVVQNATVPQAARRAAIDVLLAQYDPTRGLDNDTWLNPELTTLGHASDYYQIAGEQPVTATDRQRIVSAFRTMSKADPDRQIRRVTARIVFDLTVTCTETKCAVPPATGM